MSFAGVLVSGEKKLFGVRENSGSVRWVALGDTISGFVVTTFDTQKEELLLRRDSESLVLRLPEGKVRGPRVPDDVSALSSLEFAYALALAGDDELTKKVIALDGMVRLKAEAEKQLEVATSEFEKGDETAKPRMKIHAAQIRARESLRETFLQLLIKAAEAKRPNKAPEPTPGSVTPRATEGVSK